ncbi:pectate lyase [Alishewanella longhuensis]
MLSMINTGIVPNGYCRDKPGAGPLWPRFAELNSNRPIFGDRDNALYYDVLQVSLERRQGYAWYTERPVQTLKQYQLWQQKFPLKATNLAAD